jgi:hypothetical protein
MTIFFLTGERYIYDLHQNNTMDHRHKLAALLLTGIIISATCASQKADVKFVRKPGENRIDIMVGNKLFTSFLYPDTIAKPVLYPIYAANGTMVTRGFPMEPKPGEPTDHPHHLGLWFNFENVNGLDFWNNSYAIAADKKAQYGTITIGKEVSTKDGKTGMLSYSANWVNSKNEVLLEEKTSYEISGNTNERIIDRVTTLTANTEVLFKDAKDGMLGLRVAQPLQIPTKAEQSFKDDKGNVTVVKGTNVANGNYLTSEGKQGDAAWSTRGKWCKLYGKINPDSISIAIIDHPKNLNYPTYWHARGYGLFAANPLGENIFTEGKKTTNLTLRKGESVTFRYRVVVQNGAKTLSVAELNKLGDEFAKRQ